MKRILAKEMERLEYRSMAEPDKSSSTNCRYVGEVFMETCGYFVPVTRYSNEDDAVKGLKKLAETNTGSYDFTRCRIRKEVTTVSTTIECYVSSKFGITSI